MSKTTPLKELADIFVGANVKRSDKIEQSDTQKWGLISNKSIGFNNEIITEEIDDVFDGNNKFHHFQVLQGDIIIITRGSTTRNAFITKEIEALNCICSNNISIIRLRRQAPISSIGLNAVLQSYIFQYFLQQELEERHQLNITKSFLGKFEVPILTSAQLSKIEELSLTTHKLYQTTIELAEMQKQTGITKITHLLQEN